MIPEPFLVYHQILCKLVTNVCIPVLGPVSWPVALLRGAVGGLVRQHLELGLEAEVRVLVAAEVLLDHVVPGDGPDLGPRRVALRDEVLRVVAAAAEGVAEVPERAAEVHLDPALRRRHLLGIPAAISKKSRLVSRSQAGENDR